MQALLVNTTSVFLNATTMNLFIVKHITRYTYASTVIDCTNQIMLYPISDASMEVKSHEITISHNPTVEVFVDYFGNRVGVFSIVKPHTELLIESVAQVITKNILFPDDSVPANEQWQHLQEIKFDIPYMDYLVQENFDYADELMAKLNETVDLNESPYKTVMKLTEYIYKTFTYKKGVTSVETPIDEVWKLKAGVCQDFAHILLICLRKLGIPGRYVSGYICHNDHEMRGEGATHAWAEAYIPWYGWLGIDPTNNCLVSDHHIKIAVGRNFADCTPVKGTYKGSGEHTLEVSVEVENGNYASPEANRTPRFYYEQKNPATPINSYREYQEIQQRQQQQQ